MIQFLYPSRLANNQLEQRQVLTSKYMEPSDCAKVLKIHCSSIFNRTLTIKLQILAYSGKLIGLLLVWVDRLPSDLLSGLTTSLSLMISFLTTKTVLFLISVSTDITSILGKG